MGSFGNGLQTGFNVISTMRANRLARKDIVRRQAADDALVQRYGTEAGDPASYASVQGTQSNIDAQHRADAVGLLGALNAANEAIPPGTPPEQAAELRGQAFDHVRELLPALGVDAAHIEPFRQRFMQDPGVIQTLATQFGGDQLIGSPNLVNAAGDAAGVTKTGRIKTFTGFKPVSTNNVLLQTDATKEKLLAPTAQQGVQQYKDPVTGDYKDRIVEGSPQQIDADKKKADAKVAADKAALAKQNMATAAETTVSRVDAAKANIARAVDLIKRDPLFQNDSLPSRAARLGAYHLPTSQLRTNLEKLAAAVKLIDLQQLRASGFSLGRVTNTEFASAADALVNTSPNLNKDQLIGELDRLQKMLDGFASSVKTEAKGGTTPAAPEDVTSIDDAFSKYGK